MLTIRLSRVGKKNQPFFKIIIIDKRKPPKKGRCVEQIGFYNPLTKERSINAERVKYWISTGAQPSDTVHNLLIKEKILTGEKVSAHKTKKKEEEAKAPSSAEATAGKEEKKDKIEETAKTDKIEKKEETAKEAKPTDKEPSSAEATAGGEEEPKV